MAKTSFHQRNVFVMDSLCRIEEQAVDILVGTFIDFREIKSNKSPETGRKKKTNKLFSSHPNGLLVAGRLISR